MINPERLQQLKESKEIPPILTDKEQIKSVIRERIQVIIGQLGRSSRFFNTLFQKHIFSLESGEYSRLENNDGEKIVLVENGQLQELGIITMKEFGIDVDKPSLKVEEDGFRSEEYRSGIKGLAFKRDRHFTGSKLNLVAWYAVDKGPQIKINFRGLLGR